MNKIRERFRWAFWLCWGWISLILLYLRYADVLPIQFENQSVRNNYRIVMMLSVPTITMLAVLFDYQLNRHKRSAPVQSLLAALIAIATFIGSFIFYFIGGRIHLDDQLLYKSRFSSEKIIVQSIPFEHKNRVVKVKGVALGLRWVIKTDTADIDQYKWQLVPKNERQIPW